MEENPWKTLGTKLIYTNPWITVREDQVIRPDGGHGIYGVVETRIATGIVALTPQEEVYMIGQYRYPVKEYSWEIVEGGADNGEAPEDAAKRELKEEAGLVAKEFFQLGPEVHLSNCFSAERAVFFMARGLTEVEKAPEGTEVLQVKKVPFTECLSMVRSGQIKDAMSIIAILRSAHYLGL
jgi:8-oxo-dGTP pyrophosphatase MutT (NUDIX family)